jgi:hypothetical protein
MRNLAFGIVLTLAAAVPARAQVAVQTPWTSVLVNPPAQPRILVQSPWFSVGVGQRPVQTLPAVPPPPADQVYVPGAPPPVPIPIPVATAAARVPTLNEFAATFQPRPGHFVVDVEHPVTGRPVRVSFTLPEGSLKRVVVHRRELDFEYRGREVSIRFLHGGEVRVRE